MLESGCVSTKNEVNIMMKNVVDIFLGGLSYWVVGYGLSFGKTWTCPVLAVGHLALDTDQLTDNAMGSHFTSFLFQLSFATTATTIVSGAMAERCNFGAYCLFSLLNTVIYCVPAGWVWGDHGFLYAMGVIDIAGSGPVHLIGGVSAFASALMLGPRLGRYGPKGEQTLGTPVNCAMGLFVLWWGWLAFNSGSTYGVTGAKWQYAAKAAVMTMLSSFGGGVVGLVYTLVANSGRTDIMDMINSVLGALVAVTAGCFLYTGWEALLIGSVGGVLTCLSGRLVDGWLGVDDPVGASSVHLVCGLWGVLAVGLFAGSSPLLPHARGTGVFKGGTGHLLAVQAIACVCLALYSLVTTLLILWVNILRFVRPIRTRKHYGLPNVIRNTMVPKLGYLGPYFVA
ncbi:hypothetical protein AAG570_000652 [Ranatra chinensis]|uniref:Ammonium transporter AmtB-like domain-containing protein n=1 Tax=Ranatra chinensis TaxID=642074 RepID=A0ABD0ZAD2_9HEMI